MRAKEKKLTAVGSADMDGFHVRAKEKKLTAVGSRCLENLTF